MMAFEQAEICRFIHINKLVMFDMPDPTYHIYIYMKVTDIGWPTEILSHLFLITCIKTTMSRQCGPSAKLVY